MKRFFLIGLLFTFSNLTAQKTVTKTIETTGLNNVQVHLKYAQNIEVKNWSKSTISVKATVNINDNKENDVFSLTTDINRKALTITSDFGGFFKESIIYIKGVKESDYDTVSINYVIYIPKNLDLNIKSISGNVSVENVKNNLTLNLISGNITIKQHSKKMLLKTISGDIDIYISDATFNAKTLSGNVYSNLDIDLKKANKTFGQKITGVVKNGNASLKINTISGDIFLRKI